MESYSQKTEKIMKIFSRFSDNCIIDLQPPEYNKAYTYIAKCLLEFELEKNGYDALTAAASNLLKKHKLNAVTEADVRWMETELESIATKANN